SLPIDIITPINTTLDPTHTSIRPTLRSWQFAMPQELLTITCMSPLAGMLITFLLTPFLTTTSQLIPGRKRTTCQAPKTMFEVALSLWIRFSCSVEEIHLLPQVALPQNQRLLSPLRSLQLQPRRRQPAPRSRYL